MQSREELKYYKLKQHKTISAMPFVWFLSRTNLSTATYRWRSAQSQPVTYVTENNKITIWITHFQNISMVYSYRATNLGGCEAY